MCAVPENGKRSWPAIARHKLGTTASCRRHKAPCNNGIYRVLLGEDVNNRVIVASILEIVMSYLFPIAHLFLCPTKYDTGGSALEMGCCDNQKSLTDLAGMVRPCHYSHKHKWNNTKATCACTRQDVEMPRRRARPGFLENATKWLTEQKCAQEDQSSQFRTHTLQKLGESFFRRRKKNEPNPKAPEGTPMKNIGKSCWKKCNKVDGHSSSPSLRSPLTTLNDRARLLSHSILCLSLLCLRPFS